MSLPECVIVCIKEHMVSVGEEIIMSVLEQQQQSGGDDVCCRVKFHIRYVFIICNETSMHWVHGHIILSGFFFNIYF